MMRHTNDPILRLLYLDDNVAYELSTFLADVWNSQLFYKVAELPKAEMAWAEATNEFAEELIGFTNSLNWRIQGRRPIRCGDILYTDFQPWLYIPADDAIDYSYIGQIKYFSFWKDFAIVRGKLNFNQIA